MKKNLEAVKTEYKGIVFRSKSEAIFARSLDILSDKSKNIEPSFRIGYVYEPNIDKIFVGNPNEDILPDYTPDFLIVYQCEHCNSVVIHIVEYKPVRPTNTYLINLGKKAKTIIVLFIMFGRLAWRKCDFFRFYCCIWKSI